MPKVILYTMEGCHYCDVLRLFLDKYKVKYKEKKLIEGDRKLLNEIRGKVPDLALIGFPITDIDGDIVTGCDIMEIYKSLRSKNLIKMKGDKK